MTLRELRGRGDAESARLEQFLHLCQVLKEANELLRGLHDVLRGGSAIAGRHCDDASLGGMRKRAAVAE